MHNSISLKLAGVAITAPAGQSILAAARAAGVFIPSLCAFPGLDAVGACRLCMVEIRGVPRLMPACATTVAEGMDVTVDSPRLQSHRRMVLELLFAERNHVCAACVANLNCELQELAAQLGVTHTRYAYRFPRHAVDASHPRFGFDANRCILCTRCVRVCGDVEGARTWNMAGRGIRSNVVTDLNQRWADAKSCTACGKCVAVCPTGALFEKGGAVGEKRKRENVLPDLTRMRTSDR